MANGTSCCAQEVCCDPPGARQKVKDALTNLGIDAQYCDILFKFMDNEELIFAHISLRPFVEHVSTAARNQTGH